MFASIFVAADNALVIDRKMPFSDKGLFSVCAGGGRIPEKLLIGAGGDIAPQAFARICKAKGVPNFCFFMGREVFGACQKNACFANYSERGDTAFCVNAPTDTN